MCRVAKEIRFDHVGLVAAGVAFYFFLALFPTLAAIVSLYGLVNDPSGVEAQFDHLRGVLPSQSHTILLERARSLTTSSTGALGWGVLLSLLLSLWSANKGTTAIFKGVNMAYNERDQRSYLKKTSVTLLFTICGLCALVLALVLIAGVPALSDLFPTSALLRTWLAGLRWPLLAFFMMLILAAVYRYAPDRESAKWRWVTVGSFVAAVLWLAGSALLSIYVDYMGSFEKTYGNFAAVVVLLFWFYLTGYAILVGAEINSELEHQTARDSTTGAELPLGERGAYFADHVASGTAVRSRNSRLRKSGP